MPSVMRFRLSGRRSLLQSALRRFIPPARPGPARPAHGSTIRPRGGFPSAGPGFFFFCCLFIYAFFSPFFSFVFFFFSFSPGNKEIKIIPGPSLPAVSPRAAAAQRPASSALANQAVGST